MDEMLKILNQYAESNDSAISDAAKKLISLAKEVQNGTLSASEFQELTKNILDLDAVDKIAETSDHRVIIREAFSVMEKVVGPLITVITSL